MEKKSFISFNFLSIIIISIVGIIIYSNTFNSGFYFDDGYNITENFLIKNMFRPDIIFNYNPSRFITLFSLSINYQLGGLNVTGYHIVNIIIHILTSLSVFWLTKTILSIPKISEKAKPAETGYIALFSALVFAAHPIQTQAITYIIQRAASLAALFYVASVLFYAKYRLAENIKKRYLFYWISAASCLLGMFTKEIVFTLPIIIILCEYIFFFSGGKFLRREFIPYLATLPIIPLTIIFSSPRAVKEVSQAASQIDAYSYFLTQFKVIIKYLGLVLFPVNQNLDYDFPVSHSFIEPYTILSFLFLTALFAFGIFLVKKEKVISFCILWFFVTLSVESSVLPIRDVIFEHRMYLPMAGVAFLLVYLVVKYVLPLKRKLVFAAGVAVIIILGFASWQRNSVWANELSLWDDVVKKSPNKARAYSNRGVAFLNLQKYDEAIRDFNKTLTLNKNFKNAYFNRGSVYYYKKEYEKAIVDFNKSISLDSAYAEAYNNIGAILIEQHKFSESVYYFDNALRIDTNYAAAYNNRGVLAKTLGDYEKAAWNYKKAIEKNPNFADAFFNLGEIYMIVKNADLAIGYFNRAIKLNNRLTGAYYKRGNVNFLAGYLDNALADFNYVIKLDSLRDDVYNNRGSVYFMSGMYTEAYSDFSRALALNKNLFDACKNRGITSMMLKNSKKAIDDFDAAQLIKKEDPEIYFFRAKAYLLDGQTKKALSDVSALNKLGYIADTVLLKKAGALSQLNLFK